MSDLPDPRELYIRVSRAPAHDLRRGRSHTWATKAQGGSFHRGLSGYFVWGYYGNMDRSIAEAVEEVCDYFYEHGADVAGRVSIFHGRDRGDGPDGEDLFKPLEILASTKIRSLVPYHTADIWMAAQDLINQLRAKGYPLDKEGRMLWEECRSLLR